MSFLKNLLAKEVTVSNRETAYAKLITLTPISPVMVDGDHKDRLLAELTIGDGDDSKTIIKSVFADAVAGRPTFIPQGGIDCQATFKQTDGFDKDNKPVVYLNLIALGVKVG